jgi:Lrp/AsnC family leucine-responsive transcriptional regulator
MSDKRWRLAPNSAHRTQDFAIWRISVAETFNLDRFDRALLDRLRIDNQASARVLGEQVGRSESAVLRRLRNLRKSGVIVADVSIVHPAVLGTPLTIHVLVSLEREGTAALDAFKRKLRGRAEVRSAWYVTGDVDFVLLLQVESMEAYEVFTREVFHDDPNVRAFRTIVSLREVKSFHEAD